ncbi:class II aldolase/adducin family protein [Pseudorhodoplanes sp.]|uniref:class II aldolase/adducin family protein n=1 Tax=Pseudorhodoplanes sp. TaxID=1934341 RepID=UPI003D0E36BB
MGREAADQRVSQLSPAGPDLVRLVRVAARAVARGGLAHAYGHCSARIDAERFLVCPPVPMGLVKPGDACAVVPLDGALPDGVLGEVRIHREIYRRRPDVGGIVRSMPPKAMSLAAMGRVPQPRHGFGSYFHPAPALWNDPQLLRTDQQAEALAAMLGEGRGILMRGNGVVTAGSSLEEAVVLTWYLEDAARIELDALASGCAESAPVFTEAEARARATWDGRIRERMWDYLTAGDIELQPAP